MFHPRLQGINDLTLLAYSTILHDEHHQTSSHKEGRDMVIRLVRVIAYDLILTLGYQIM